MESSEVDKSSKEGKPAKDPTTPVPQEPSAVAAGQVADWSGFQTYSPMPPHGFVASSPQPHPYMWGVHQQYMPPYGTPPHPYVAMYPQGIYAHPTMAPGSYPFSPFAMPAPNGIAETSGMVSSNVEVAARSSEVKEKLPIKRSKGSLGSLNMITGKNNEPSKTPGQSANGVHSKSAESASDDSSGGSEAHSENESQAKSSDRPDSAEPSQNGSSSHNYQNGGQNPPHSMINQSMGMVPIQMAGAVSGVPSPTTNLNIGMDYWGGASSPAVPAIRGNVSATPVSGGYVTNGSREVVQSHLSVQDERELKRQKRKQSNRESARRSRMRKQAECDELAQRAEVLKEENASLRAEVVRMRSEYDDLLAQNKALQERLGELPHQEDPRNGHGDQHA